MGQGFALWEWHTFLYDEANAHRDRSYGVFENLPKRLWRNSIQNIAYALTLDRTLQICGNIRSVFSGMVNQYWSGSVNRNVTMQDIADRLGVSKVTVSKALNNKEGVGEELRLKIKKTAEEMGYRYNSCAKSVKYGLTYNIGVISPEKFTGTNSFYISFYKMISKELDRRGYSAILHTLSHEEEASLRLPRLYYECKADGLIILGQVGTRYAELLGSIDIPVVFLDFYDKHSEIDSVISDNFHAAYELTNYLIENGHREIAYSETSMLQAVFRTGILDT